MWCNLRHVFHPTICIMWIWHVVCFGLAVTSHTMNISHHSLRKNTFQDEYVFVLFLKLMPHNEHVMMSSSEQMHTFHLNWSYSCSSASGLATSGDHFPRRSTWLVCLLPSDSSQNNSESYQQDCSTGGTACSLQACTQTWSIEHLLKQKLHIWYICCCAGIHSVE